jgi:hypothetical protein
MGLVLTARPLAESAAAAKAAAGMAAVRLLEAETPAAARATHQAVGIAEHAEALPRAAT